MNASSNGQKKNGQHPVGSALNILMVDDDEICLFIQRRIMDLSGVPHNIQTAPNGKVALEFLQAAAAGVKPLPHLILLDLQMPVMNGREFMEAFSCMDFPGKEQITVALLTSSVWESDKTLTMSLGASHYLTKPFTVESFQAVLMALHSKPALAPVSPALHPQENNNFRTRLI